MKAYKFLLGTVLSGMMLAGCADLDTAPKGDTVTDDQKKDAVEQNPSMASAAVSAITSSFSFFVDATALGHNDFGYPSVMLLTDSRGMDMVSTVTGFNWFSNGVTLGDYQNTSDENSMIWDDMYKQIFAANAVTKTISVDTEESQAQYFLAQALGIRAFDYFILAQLYQYTYEGNLDAPCVPLLLDTNADEVGANGAKRATVGAVYEQIMTDLNNAVDLLSKTKEERADKRYLNLGVALGLRARVEMVMQNWEAAAADAQKAIDCCGATPLTVEEASVPGFNKLDAKNWMWGIYVDETDRVVTTGICNWPSHMGSLCYGYASVGGWRRINVDLYNRINSTDVRKGWWLDTNGKSANLTSAEQKYLTSDVKAPAYTQVKFGAYKDEIGTSTNACDIPLMRVEEMYYILAEAQAMAGNPAQGLATLKNFTTSYRDPGYNVTASSAESVQEAVWMQRRIELWGEGLSYYDLMRLRKGIDRRGSGVEAAYQYVIRDTKEAERQAITTVLSGKGGTQGTELARLIFRIPNAEIESNKLLEPTDDNLSSPTLYPVN